MTNDYVDQNGKYLFSFDGDVEAPAGAAEVAEPPSDAIQIWSFQSRT